MSAPRRPLRRILIAASALFVVAAGATAWAARAHIGAAFMKRMVSARIDAALDAAQATDSQRAAVHQASERVFAAFVAEHQGGPGADLERGLALFESERPDPDAALALRADKQAKMQRIGEVVTQAVHETFDALTPTQRQAVAGYVRANLPALDGHHRDHFARMASAKLDEALDAAQATDAQRATLHAGRDRVIAAFTAAHRTHREQVEQALVLFTAPSWDEAAVAAHRAARQAEIQRVGDVVMQAIGEAHDTLSAPQRKAVADFVRAHHGRHHE